MQVIFKSFFFYLFIIVFKNVTYIDLCSSKCMFAYILSVCPGKHKNPHRAEVRIEKLIVVRVVKNWTEENVK